ncbi:MAG: RluA family pseudouridine synthase [Planctomycetota bacterium]|jgi:RluA family pseudouridine synthase
MSSSDTPPLDPEVHVVPDEAAGSELDEYLCLLFPGVTKGALRRLVRDGQISLDGAEVHPSTRLRRHQVILCQFDPDALPRRKVAADLSGIGVLFESEEILAIQKPPAIAVEPERWAAEEPCLADAARALEAHCAPGTDGLPVRLRTLHRLDKGTSGVLLMAKHLEAERRLRGAFAEGRIAKRYLALVEGCPNLTDGERATIDKGLGPDPRKSGRMRIDAKGKPSVTEYEIVERFHGFSLLACYPHTGRTHQIRVHLAAEGFPLLVDPVYGRRSEFLLSEVKRDYKLKPGRTERPLIDHLTLHAEAIAFPHNEAGDTQNPPEFDAFGGAAQQPEHRERGDWTEVRAPLPASLERVLKQLRKVRPHQPRRAYRD